jgi:Uri superfamily endonuclease
VQRVNIAKDASIYFLRQLLADNLNGPIGERNRVSTAHRTADRDTIEGVAMVLVGEGGTTALLLEELDIACKCISLGSGGYGGVEDRVQREVGNGAGEFWDADGLEKRAGRAVSWNGAVGSRASKRATPDLDCSQSAKFLQHGEVLEDFSSSDQERDHLRVIAAGPPVGLAVRAEPNMAARVTILP